MKQDDMNNTATTKEQRLLETARVAFEAYIELRKVEATYEAAGAAYAKAKAKFNVKQGHVKAVEGDIEAMNGYLDAAIEVEEKFQWAESNAIRANEDYNRFKNLSQAEKDKIAVAWYTREGQEKADREHEAACESRAAAWFEEAAYGRGD